MKINKYSQPAVFNDKSFAKFEEKIIANFSCTKTKIMAQVKNIAPNSTKS